MSGCACIYVESDDPLEILFEYRGPAHYHWKCYECDGIIKPGDLFEVFTGRDSYHDEVSTYHTCGDCLSIRAEFFCAGWAFGMMFEDVGTHIDEVYGEISSECLAALTPTARGWVIDMIDEVWEEMEDEDGGGES
jgi:hypothetical protein